ncbi:MAG TPA: hypothetical protein VMH33_01110 [Solirubrobacterales bacterium]|nr:hypothetical protein [Solirubrobacterales bacterium]
MRIRSGAISLFVAALLATVAVPGTYAAEPEPSFCATRTLHDYLTPLKSMPKLREIPYRAQSNAHFRGVDVGSSGPALSIGGGSSAGYQLQWDKNPGWLLTLTFAQVNQRGRVVRSLGERHTGLASLPGGLGIAEPRIYLPPRPGIYRTTMVIRSHSGRRLATFGNYYRVIRPKIDNRLVTDAPTYQPGSTLLARVENPGATTVLFGEEFKIEQLSGGTWGPASAAPGPITTGLYWLAAGTAGGMCDSFPIPPSMPAGKYRVAQEAVVNWNSRKTELRPILYAEFEVAAPIP